MRKAIIATWLLACCVLISAHAEPTRGFSGSIQFDGGRVVPFEFLGSSKEVANYKIFGKIGNQTVSYDFADLAEIIFTDYKGHQYSEKYKGPVIVVSKSGKRFTLDDAWCWKEHYIRYVYLDPITEKRMDAYSPILKAIQSITIGETAGSMKVNPATGEYFPALYSFDPFTGQKLEWADRP